MSKYNSDTQTNGRDPQSGRFLSGNNGGGRPKGSRNKLSEEFLADLCNEWQRNGKVALERMCANHPEQFCKLVGSLLPARIDQTLSVDVDLFAKPKPLPKPTGSQSDTSVPKIASR